VTTKPLPYFHRRAGSFELEPLPPAQGEVVARMDAEHGSRTLERECRQLFWRFSKQHRVSVDEARILMLNTGVRL
jgi:hypothetical protein